MTAFNERIKPFSELPGLKSQLSEFKFKLESLEKIKESVSAENYLNLSSANQNQINELTAKVELLSSGLGILKNEIELDSQMLESENSILEKEIGELQLLLGGGALSKKDHDEKQGKLKQKIAKNRSHLTVNHSSLKELDYYATYIGNESYIKHTYNEGLGNVKSKFSNIRPRTWISLGIIVLLVIAGILLYNPVKEIITEKMDWNKAVKENTYDEYGYFISKYPASKNFQEAIAKQEEAYWKMVLKSKELSMFESYLSFYPGGIYKDQANSCRDSLSWEKIRSSSNINDFDAYISMFPVGKFVGEAKEKIAILKPSDKLVDNRDGKEYRTVRIDNQTWMAENLAYASQRGNYWAYNDNQNNATTYGFLYDWETAMEACPAGWHLPTDNEWAYLIDYLGGEKIAGGKMKTTSEWLAHENGNATNESRFDALPAGYRDSNDGSYKDLGSNTFFWTSTPNGDKYAWRRNLYYGYGEVGHYYYGRNGGFSVRCNKNTN